MGHLLNRLREADQRPAARQHAEEHRAAIEADPDFAETAGRLAAAGGLTAREAAPLARAIVTLRHAFPH